MIKLLITLGLGLIPLLLWGGYFYYKNPRKQGLGEISRIFLLGTLSIIPVIFFHQWLLGTLMPTLQEKWPLFDRHFMDAFLELSLFLLFVLAFVILFSVLSFLTSILLFRGQVERKSLHEKLYNFTPILLFFGLFLLIDGLSNLTLKESFLISMAGSTILFAVMEEYFKYAINPFLVTKKINSVGTAMVHALYVGLAFAFVENLLFFYVSYNSANFGTLVAYRSLATSLLHVGASGILGYFYGISLFAHSIIATYEIERGQYKLPVWLRGFFRKDKGFQSISVTQGFFLAAFFHSTFNLLLHLRLKTLAILVVIVLSILVVLLLRTRSSQAQYGLIGSASMPQVDFEKLKLQIAFLKEKQAIEAARSSSL